MLVSGGVIHCHDYDNPETMQAIDECIKHSDKYTDFKIVSSPQEFNVGIRAIKTG